MVFYLEEGDSSRKRVMMNVCDTVGKFTYQQNHKRSASMNNIVGHHPLQGIFPGFCQINRLESIQHLIIGIQIVLLAFVSERCKIIQDTYPHTSQPHVVPQLLTMIRNKMLHCLTFYIHLLVHKEIHLVRVLYLLPMVLGGK